MRCLVHVDSGLIPLMCNVHAVIISCCVHKDVISCGVFFCCERVILFGMSLRLRVGQSFGLMIGL